MRNTIIGKKKNEGFAIEWINPIGRYWTSAFNVEFSLPCNPIASNFYVIAGDGTAFNTPSEASIVISSVSSDGTQCQVTISGMVRDGDVILAINNGALLSTSNIPLSGGTMANGTRYESEIHYLYTAIPQIMQYYPADGSSYTLPYSNFTLAFNQNITRGTAGFIKIWDASTNPATLVQTIQYNYADKITIKNNVVTIAHDVLGGPGLYYITIDNNILRSPYNVAFVGINDATTWNFSTPFVVPAAVTNVRRITNGKSSITIAYDKGANVKVLVLALKTTNGALANYDDNTFSSTGSELTGVNTVSTDASYAGAVFGGASTVSTFKKVYNGTAGQIKITGLDASSNYRFYVISYATDNTDFKFNTDVVTLDCKTNRY